MVNPPSPFSISQIKWQTTLLGVAALVSYHRARSLWPAVVMHYLTVVLWLSFGGLTLLAGS